MKFFVSVVLLAVAVSAQIPAGWNYNPFDYYPFTNMQPPVQETPDVVAARNAHLAAHAAARGLPAVQQPLHDQPAQDTPEIWAAKVEFWRAYNAAAAANGVASNLPPLVSVHQHVHHGVQDTPEVAAAKAEFFRAYSQAAALAAQQPE